MTAPKVYKHAKPMYLSIDAFAEHFQVGNMTIYRLCHEGAVKWIRVGRQMRIPVSEVERFTKDALHASSVEVWGEA